MKRYYNNSNLALDPTRYLYNNGNNELLGFNKPINKLQEDIIINNLSLQKKRFKPQSSLNNEDISLQFLPKNNTNQLVPVTANNNVQNYNNDTFRFKNMSQELMDKDEEIQRYKNEIYQLQNELGESKKKNSKMISYDMENQMLKDKLNEHYTISRALTEAKHNLKRERIDNKSNLKTILLLKKIIHKQHLQLSTKEYEDNEEDTEDSDDYETDLSNSDESDYSSEEEEEEEEEEIKNKDLKKIYYNNRIKNSLLKQKLPSKKIDQSMIQMKITPKTKITKKLLINLLNTIKK